MGHSNCISGSNLSFGSTKSLQAPNRAVYLLLLFLVISTNCLPASSLLELQSQQTSGSAVASVSIGGNNSFPTKEDDSSKAFEEFKASPYFVEPFEEGLKALPAPQVQFVRQAMARDFDLFREITRDAIKRRGKFGSSAALMLRWTGKLLGTFIRNRQEELRLPEFKEPKGEFFDYMADLMERGINLSTDLKRNKYPSKNSVDSDEFYNRVDSLFNYFAKVLNKSTVGMYIKWANLSLYKDEPSNVRYNVNVTDEGSDLFAVSLPSPLDSPSVCQRCSSQIY